MTISLRKNPKLKLPQCDFKNQIMRALMNTVPEDDNSEYDYYLAEPQADAVGSRRGAPSISVPAASKLTQAQIADAIDKGIDPWSEDIEGTPFPNLCSLPMRTLLTAVQFNDIVRTRDHFDALFLTGQFTVIRALNEGQLNVLNASLGDIIVEGKKLMTQRIGSSDRLKILAYDPIFAATRHQPADYMARFAPNVDKALQRGHALIVIACDAHPLSPEANEVITQNLQWPSVTQNIILKLLKYTHSVTGMIAEDALKTILPSDDALSKMSPTLLMNALYAQTTIAVAQRLASHAAIVWSKRRIGGLNLDDLKGLPDVHRALSAIVTDLQDWQDGRVAWEDVNASVLLAGPPGTGKTMSAAAFAGSAGIKLFSTSYTDLQKHGHLGDYLREMSSIVDNVIAAAPAVIFFDELDSFGARSGSEQHNKRYTASVVNDLLQQLTRLNATPGVIVMAATNYPEHIDKAIIRSGRFDIKLKIEHPNKEGVKDILSHHLGVSDYTSDDLIGQLVGLSGADLAFIARDARGRARRGRCELSPDHVMQAADAFAPPGTSSDMRRIAGHEAGHIVMSFLLGLSLPTGAIATPTGGTVRRQTPRLYTADGVGLEMAYIMGGRAAEHLICGSISSGSGGEEGSDLDLATSFALAIETEWGIGDSGLLFAPVTLNSRPAMSVKLRTLVNAHLEAAQGMALRCLSENMDLLQNVTDALLTSRELDEAQIAELFAKSGTPRLAAQLLLKT